MALVPGYRGGLAGAIFYHKTGRRAVFTTPETAAAANVRWPEIVRGAMRGAPSVMDGGWPSCGHSYRLAGFRQHGLVIVEPGGRLGVGFREFLGRHALGEVLLVHARIVVT